MLTCSVRRCAARSGVVRPCNARLLETETLMHGHNKAQALGQHLHLRTFTGIRRSSHGTPRIVKHGCPQFFRSAKAYYSTSDESYHKIAGSVGSDIDIARAANMQPIMQLAKERLGIDADNLEPYGHVKAKLTTKFTEELEKREDGKLILVTAITPTKSGEGKTTTSVGLTDGLCRLGKKAMVALREPSLGPVFGMKGGAAGGGFAQVVPMDDINLHFTGDFHAIGAAHNLLCAMVDNHIYWGNANPLRPHPIDIRRVEIRRVVDMNDRALRHVTIGLGAITNGFPREDGYDITVASEVMAIFCLSKDLADLQQRLAKIVVGYTRDRKPVTAGDIKADGAMTALLKEALNPNIVQTLENNLALVHGGPFANIAHGCNSIIATRAALKLSDYVVTEAGFGADLGAQKFFDIKCRKGNLKPAATVVVATCRALKMHGGVAFNDLKGEDVAAVERGMPNLLRHLENMTKYNVPPIVAVNRFPTDTQAEMAAVIEGCSNVGVKCIVSEHHALGGQGAVKLAEAVLEQVENNPGDLKLLYADEMPIKEKVETIAKEIYGAAAVSFSTEANTRIKQITEMGFSHLPVCMAKTQYSFSSDAKALGAPTGHTLPVREVRLSAGAEFVVVISGAIMTMPGLPSSPAAEAIGIGADGNIEGLF